MVMEGGKGMITLLNLRDVKMRLLYYGMVFSLGIGFFAAGEMLAVTTGTKTVYQPTKTASLVIKVPQGHEVNLADLPVGMPVMLVTSEKETQDVLNKKMTGLGYQTYYIVSDERWNQLKEGILRNDKVRMLGVNEVRDTPSLNTGDTQIVIEVEIPPIKPNEVQDTVEILMKNGYNLVLLN
ncbi:MAG: hypothetical protein ACYDG6_15055 [Thermincolia bacterium]